MIKKTTFAAVLWLLVSAGVAFGQTKLDPYFDLLPPDQVAGTVLKAQTAAVKAVSSISQAETEVFISTDDVDAVGMLVEDEGGSVRMVSGDVVVAVVPAAALGDIGRHFPDDDPRWKGADSRRFLRETLALLAARGLRPVNVDATVITEAPRLGEHVAAIRGSLAEILELPLDRVSVKAKSAESMGSLGRGEGLAVLALATVEEVAGA